MCVKNLDDCDCACHREGSGMYHVISCCFQCRRCGRRKRFVRDCPTCGEERCLDCMVGHECKKEGANEEGEKKGGR